MIKIDKVMGEQIVNAINEQISQFKFDPKKFPTEFAIALPVSTSINGDASPFLLRFLIKRPSRVVNTGPVMDKYKSGYTEYYGVDEVTYWGDDD